MYQKFGNCMDLLLIKDESKSHYVFIKDFNRLMCNKTKIKNKKTFANIVCNVLVIKKILIEHNKTCLIIYGKQGIKLEGGSIEFQNHFKQLAVPFNIYADFESLLKGVKSSGKNNASYTEKYQDHILFNFAYKVVCVINRFSKKVVLYRVENAVYRFIKAILEHKK